MKRLELPDFDLEHKLKLWTNARTKKRGDSLFPRLVVQPGSARLSDRCIYDMDQMGARRDMERFHKVQTSRVPSILVAVGGSKNVRLHPITFTLWIFSQISTAQASRLGGKDTLKHRSPRLGEGGYLKIFTNPTCACCDPESKDVIHAPEYWPDGTLKPMFSPCVNPNHWTINIDGEPRKIQFEMYDEFILNPVESPWSP